MLENLKNHSIQEIFDFMVDAGRSGFQGGRIQPGWDEFFPSTLQVNSNQGFSTHTQLVPIFGNWEKFTGHYKGGLWRYTGGGFASVVS